VKWKGRALRRPLLGLSTRDAYLLRYRLPSCPPLEDIAVSVIIHSSMVALSPDVARFRGLPFARTAFLFSSALAARFVFILFCVAPRWTFCGGFGSASLLLSRRPLRRIPAFIPSLPPRYPAPDACLPAALHRVLLQ